ncbi:hypothetical protein V6U71_10730 [Sphingopyxis sp. J-6]|uniref:hypothetical protein n=1 Tax=Sphingopyxis sp. J-6 TaxID=3122054 RepID=UPI0039845188
MSLALADASIALIADFLNDGVEKQYPPSLQAILHRYPSPPTALNREQLIEIAREKNGGKLAKSKALKALEGNSNAAVLRLTGLAFAEPDVEIQMRLLIGLGGVGVPTASAILTWTNPNKFAVIDRRACAALMSIVDTDINPKSVAGWISYLAIAKRVAKRLGVTPMIVDRRLYSLGDSGPKRSG